MVKPEYITTNEAAKILGVTRYHVSKLARDGAIKSIRHSDPLYGNKVVLLILKDSLIDYQGNKSKRGRPGSG